MSTEEQGGKGHRATFVVFDEVGFVNPEQRRQAQHYLAGSSGATFADARSALERALDPAVARARLEALAPPAFELRLWPDGARYAARARSTAQGYGLARVDTP